MPNIGYGCVSALSNSGTGNQDITLSGDYEPKLAVFHMMNATTSGGAVTDGMQVSTGATDGTTSFFLAASSEHGQATTNSNSRGRTGACIGTHDMSGTDFESEATFVEWIQTGSLWGVRINWSSAVQKRMLVELYGGAAFDGKVDILTTTGTIGVEDTVSGQSSPAEAVMFVTDGRDDGLSDVAHTDAHFSYGFGHHVGGAIVNRGYAWKERDARVSGDPMAELSSQEAVGALSTVAFTPSWELSAVSATGYGVTQLNGAGSAEIGCVKFSTRNAGLFEVRPVNPNDSTGEYQLTGTRAKAGMFAGVLTQITAANQFRSTDQAGSFSLYHCDDTLEQGALCAQVEDGSATTNTSCYYEDGSAFTVRKDDGAAGRVAHVTGFTNTGIDIDVTAVGGAGNNRGCYLTLCPDKWRYGG